MDEDLLKTARDKYERFQRYRAALSEAERDLNDAVDALLAGGASEADVRKAITGYGDVRPRLSRAPRSTDDRSLPRRQPPPSSFKAGDEGWWDNSK